MKPIIRVEHLSKQYRLGARQPAATTLGESLGGALRAPLKALRGRGPGAGETLWALRDVGFEVRPGEVVGIIGRNGAGKSTLLKILSRITEPTAGRIELYGRVGSLLEVGTGFHPELTGRENVYLNGAILGMGRREIDRKFDEIVAFAEIERFLDTPVKRYSSGMYVRLAFAVAAHLESEVLIIDEVLAVGDVAFQKKCLGKMESARQEGRTVLFVSHSLPAVTRLCPRSILLGNGQVLQDGPSHQVIASYLRSDTGYAAVREWPDVATAPGDDVVRLRAVRVKAEDGSVSPVVDIRCPVRLEITYEVIKSGAVFSPCFSLLNQEGIVILTAVDTDPTWRSKPRPPGRYMTTAFIPGNFFAEGYVSALVSVGTFSPTLKKRVYERDVVGFQVVDSHAGDSARGHFVGDMTGVVRPLLPWRTVGPDESAEGPRELSPAAAGGTPPVGSRHGVPSL